MTRGLHLGFGIGPPTLSAWPGRFQTNAPNAKLVNAGGGGGAGYTGNISINGKNFVNGVGGAGSIIQLRGGNMSGLENTHSSSGSDWADTGGTPNWATYATWNPNVVRFPLNASNWLGLTVCGTTSVPITFTATPASGSTGGTLTAPWALASSTFPINFNTGNSLYTIGTFTNGSTAVTWASLSGTNTNANAVVVNWASTTQNADFNGTYQASLKSAIAAAQAIGCYVILDLHWCSPAITIGGVTHYLLHNANQSAFADASTAIPFWTSIASTFGTGAAPISGINNNGILFELFNEPYLDQGGFNITTGNGSGSTVTDDVALLNGGWSSALVNCSQGGTNFIIPLSWQLAGYQAILTAIRGAGANNPLLVNGNDYAGNTKNYAVWHPTDTLGTPQVGHAWHPYVNTYNGTNNYPYTAYGPYPSCGSDNSFAAPSATDINFPLSVMNTGGYPLIATEYGDYGGTTATATPYAEPAANYLQTQADANGFSGVHWQWNGTRAFGTTSSMHYSTAFASDGVTVVPILGEGTTIYNWIEPHA